MFVFVGRVDDVSFGIATISARSIPRTYAGLSPKQTSRLEIVVVIEIIGREGTDLIDANLMSEAMTTAEFAKKPFWVVSLRISQYLRILGERDELGRDLAIDGNHWMSSQSGRRQCAGRPAWSARRHALLPDWEPIAHV